MFRPGVRRLFAAWQALPRLDRLHFLLSAARYAVPNRRFRRRYPDFALPPDRLLHETYRLDYDAYARDGLETARELVDRCRAHLPAGPVDILEWGCGVARITRHLPGLPGIRSVTGADVHAGMISWDSRHIPGVDFRRVEPSPPMPFADQRFDIILGVSVLTHIPGDRQTAWLDELRRILRPGGVLLLTTQGRAFLPKLSRPEQRILRRDGMLIRDYPQPGHRMMSAFHDPGHFRSVLALRFDVLDVRDGSEDPRAAGGQDLWLLQRTPVGDRR